MYLVHGYLSQAIVDPKLRARKEIQCHELQIGFALKDSLKKLEGTEKELLSYINKNFSSEYRRSFEKIISTLINASTAPKNHHWTLFPIPPSITYSLLEELSQIAHLFWGTTPCLFNSLAKPLSIEGEVLQISPQESKINFFFKRATKEGVIDRALLPSHPIFLHATPPLLVQSGLIQKIDSEIPWKILQRLKNHTPDSLYKEEEIQNWIEEGKEDEDFHNAFSIIDNRSKKTASTTDLPKSQPMPLIRFHDMRGMIVSLFMEYLDPIQQTALILPFIPKIGTKTTIDTNHPWRNFEEESSWEKDLLSTGFRQTTFDTGDRIDFRYFCESDKSEEAIHLLISCGWKIIDSNNRPLLLIQNIHLSHERQHDDESIQLTPHIEIESLIPINEKEITHAFISSLKAHRHATAYIPSGSVSLFYPLDMRSSFSPIIDEIEITPTGKYSIKPIRRGLLESHIEIDPRKFNHTQSSLRQIPFLGTLYPYQEEGVSWLLQQQNTQEPALLADEMGLGKTIEILSWISRSHTDSATYLIITPKALLFHWSREIIRFIPDADCFLYQGPERERTYRQKIEERTDKGPLLVITSFHTVRTDSQFLSTFPFKAIIIDEAQHVKNPESDLFQAIKQLSAHFVVIMTGTPFENSMRDIWGLFALFNSTPFEPLKKFLEPFTSLDPKIHAQAVQKVRALIKPFVLRRTKQEVLKELPECIEENILIDMEEEEKEQYLSFIHALKSKKIFKTNETNRQKERMEIFEAITRLRQLVCHPKLFSFHEAQKRELPAKWTLFFEDLRTAIAEGKKVLIFSHFSSMIDLIVEEASTIQGWKGVFYHGSSKKWSVEEAVDLFQNDPSVSFFATTMKSGGTGLNLTKADMIFIYDPWWNRSVENQAIGRAHRIGKKGSLMVRRYITHNSIEERVLELADRKAILFEKLFGQLDEDPLFYEEESLDEIFSDLLEKEFSR